jgi:hypothetical protein
MLNNNFYLDETNTTNNKLWFNKKLPMPITNVKLLNKYILLKCSNIDNIKFIFKYEKIIFYLFVLYIQHSYSGLKLLVKKSDIYKALQTIDNDDMYQLKYNPNSVESST